MKINLKKFKVEFNEALGLLLSLDEMLENAI